MTDFEDISALEPGRGEDLVQTKAESRFEKLQSLLKNHIVAAKLIEEVGTVAHEAWKKDHFAMRGQGTPRWKGTKDQNFIDKYSCYAGTESFPWLRIEGDKLEVNIADMSYADLPTDWQAENRATGEVVLGLLRDAVKRGLDPFSQEFLREATDEIHVQWIVRNGQYAEDFQKQSIAEMVGVVRTENDPNQVRAYRNIIMDLNYVLAGIGALLKQEFDAEMGFDSASLRAV